MNIRSAAAADVNASEYTFTPVRDEKGDAIRFGLGAVKNVGQNAVEEIIRARVELGRFKSIYQFCEHADMQAINRRVMESLVKAGAMDSLDGTRAQLLLALDVAIETGNRAAKDRDSGQGGLFGGGPARKKNIPNLRFPKPTTGLSRKNCRARRNCSDSTSPAILSIVTKRKSPNLRHTTRRSWRVLKRAPKLRSAA